MCPVGATGPTCAECISGYEKDGETCVIAPPPADGLQLWLEPEEGIGFTPDKAVSFWKDHRGGAKAWQLTGEGTTRPIWVANAHNGRPVVRFDGVDDTLDLTSFSGLSGTEYTVVVAMDPKKAIQSAGLVGLSKTASSWPFQLDKEANGFFVMTHRGTGGVGAGDTVSVGGGLDASPRVLVATRRGDIDFLRLDVSGLPVQTSATAKGVDIAGTGIFHVGHTYNGYFDGDVFEVLVYSKVLTLAESNALKQYLTIKWAL
jgi:hypothetical protein